MGYVKMDWEDPEQPGWYATQHCWDPREGSFGGAHYWDGIRWREDKDGKPSDLPIGAHVPQRFDSFAAAEAFAIDNYLGW